MSNMSLISWNRPRGSETIGNVKKNCEEVQIVCEVLYTVFR
jgi:hypothetical protein